jgi:hypothetical protein
MKATWLGRALLAGAAAVLVVSVPALASPLTTATGDGWGTAHVVPGIASPNADDIASVNAVSCAAAGDCGAGGSYTGAKGRQQAFVVSEVKDTWRKAEAVPGLAALNKGGYAAVTALSCSSPGNCSAGGEYAPSPPSRVALRTEAFVVTQTDGHWGKAVTVPGLPALNKGELAQVYSLSCSSPGNCATGGYYSDAKDHPHGFVASESNGSWRPAQKLRFPTGRSATAPGAVVTVSCAAAGDCGAGGAYYGQAFVVSEAHGTWRTAHLVPVTEAAGKGAEVGGTSVTAIASTISCTAPGDCTAAVNSISLVSVQRRTYVLTESHGTWGKLKEIPRLARLNTAKLAQVYTISCASPGNCTVGGDYSPGRGDDTNYAEAFVATERSGVWHDATEVPGTGSLNSGKVAVTTSVSCPSAGNCSAGGSYTGAGTAQQGFVVSESGGTWGKAVAVPGLVRLNAGGSAAVTEVSCPTAAYCAAAGFYGLASGAEGAFLVTR